MHGTIVPPVTSIEQEASTSHGMVFVIRERDAQAAEKYNNVKASRHSIKAFWEMDTEDC